MPHGIIEVMPSPIQNIFFDAGSTLLFPDWSAVLRPLWERGCKPTLPQWQATERRTKQEFDLAVQESGLIDQSYWVRFYGNLFELLGFAPDDSLRNALIAGSRISANWNQLRPGTRNILESLARGHRLAVISNADGKVAQVLQQCGLADLFLSITDSGVVGYEKPSPKIFEAALSSIHAAAAESIYVGDIYSLDYLGATRVGMQAILLDVCGAYKDSGVPRVDDLQGLALFLENS